MSNVLGKRTIVIAIGAIVALAAAMTLLGLSLSRMASATTGCVRSLADSTFEIDAFGTPLVNDANLVVDNPAACIDWLDSDVAANADVKADKASGQTDDSFGQGTAEDDPNPTIVNGSIPPEKSDLKAFGVYEEDDATTGDPIAVHLFWTRVQNPNGTTNMDFELNQVQCLGNATTCANNGTRKNPLYVTPKRTGNGENTLGPDDILISYDLSKGGTVPTISIRYWTGTAWGPEHVISGGQNADAVGSINTNSITGTNTVGGVALGSLSPYTFGEASVSFDALFGANACASFGSAYLKSRSSDSFTAEVKDFVAPEAVQLGKCESGITSSQSFIPNDTATISGNGTITGTVKFILYRTQAACDADTTNVGTNGVYIESKTIPANTSAPYTTSTTNDGTPSAQGAKDGYTIDSTTAGAYVWGVSYSGDGNHNPSRSCVEDSSVTINNS